MFKVVPVSKASSTSPTGTNAGPSGGAGQPLFASISSTPKHASGIILKAGRKGETLDLTFSNDKGVSRSHLTLRLVKLGVDTPPGTPDEKESGDEAAEEEERTNAFSKPRNPEEIAACQAASDGIILVVEDIGSKFGTEIEYEVPCEDGSGDDDDDDDDDDDEDDANAAEGKKKDDDETDDETDDKMGTAPSSQVTPKPGGKKGDSGASSSNKSNTKLVRHRIQKNETFILSTLSLPNEKDHEEPMATATTSKALPIVRIGLGPPAGGDKLPSGEMPLPAALLEVSRIPVNLCVTRVDPKIKAKLTKIAPDVGVNIAHSKEGWNAAPSHPLLAYTHLLAPDMTSTAKSISAWCLKQPIVTTDYILEGLAGRKTIRDPMPKEDDYIPQGGDGVVTTDAAKMEEAGDGPFGGRRDPLKGFVVISLAASETEGLVMAAGGTIYRACLLDDSDFNAGTWLDELEAAEKAPIPSAASSASRAGGTVVLIETTSRKVKKRRDYLRKRNIRGVQQKNFAVAINEMKGVLVDGDGNEIFGREGVPSNFFRLGWGKAGSQEEQQAAAKEDSPQESEAARLSTIQEVSREDVSREEGSEKPSSAETKKAPTPSAADNKDAKADDIAVVPEDKAPEVAQEEEKEEEPTRGKRKRGGGVTNAAESKEVDGDEEAEEPKATKRAKKSRSAKEAKEPAEDEPMAAADEPAPAEEESSRPKRKRIEEQEGAARPKKKRGGDKAAKEQDENEERIVAPTSNPNDHRKPLPKKKNGWLSSAPKDAHERAKYKSTKADLDEMDTVFPSESAITVKKKGLVVRSNEEYRQRQAQMRSAREGGPRIVTGRDGEPVKDFKKFRKNSVIRNANSGSGGVRLRSVLPRESERQRQLEQMERDLEKSQREAEALFNGEESGSIRNFFGSTAKKKKKKGSRTRR